MVTTFEAIKGLSTVLGSEAEQVTAALTFIHGQTPVETDLQARRLQALAGTLLANSLAAQVLANALQPQIVVDGVTLGISNITGDGLYPSDIQASALDTAETLAFLAAQAQSQASAGQAPPAPIGNVETGFCGTGSVICPSVAPLLGTLLALQHSDGGWGYADGDSDVRLTAEILSVLMPLRSSLGIDGPLSQAVVFLLYQQSPDGHFGSAIPATSDTAVALLALLGAPVTQSAAIQLGEGFLGGSQDSDGSWNESELDTALVLRALRASLPNLAVTQPTPGFGGSLSLSDANPAPGEMDTASLSVQNTGAGASPATSVAFIAVSQSGQPNVNLGVASLPSIPAGGSFTLTYPINTAGLQGSYLLQATIDPTNQIEEATTGDNVTTTPLLIQSGTDLAISTSDIVFATQPSGQLLVTVTVHEYGQAVSTPFQVGIYQGDPTSGGQLIGSLQTISSIGTGGTALVTALWDPTLANGPTPIYAVADVGNVINDDNHQNNAAFRFYYGPVYPTDLEVSAGDNRFRRNPCRKGRPRPSR